MIASCEKPVEPSVRKDLLTLVRFIEVYCHGQHPAGERAAVDLRGHDVAKLAGRTVELCPQCSKLLQHALVKRCNCPREPKPQCKHCPSHCYAPAYRQQIRQVMRYAGPRMLLRGRIDYLFHLLF